MGTHLDGVTLEGESGCTTVSIPDIALLAGQFLVPVLLLDEEGVHKYQEFLIPENLIVRAHTRDVGLFIIKHEWAQRPDLQDSPPQPKERGGEKTESAPA
jgi:hypothetical protein